MRISIEMRFELRSKYLNIIRPKGFPAIGSKLKLKSQIVRQNFEEGMQYAIADPKFVQLMNEYLEVYMYVFELPDWMDEENRLIKH